MLAFLRQAIDRVFQVLEVIGSVLDLLKSDLEKVDKG
jgi:hypothetical protein